MKQIDLDAYGADSDHDGAWKFFRDVVRDLLVSGQAKTYDAAASKALDLMQALSADHRVYTTAGGSREDAHADHANGFDAIAARIEKSADADTMVTAGELDVDDSSF